MNLHAPTTKQRLRESKHHSALSTEYSRCHSSATTQPYSFIATPLKPLEQHHSEGVRSQSIPICKASLRRTASELKLYEDQAMADLHDYVFFTRLLTGISKQQKESTSDAFIQESDECLAHIIGTRNGSLDHAAAATANHLFDDRATFTTTSATRFEEEKDEGIFVMDF